MDVLGAAIEVPGHWTFQIIEAFDGSYYRLLLTWSTDWCKTSAEASRPC
ncbi:hypothetical protein [Streptomyces sp. ALB3]